MTMTLSLFQIITLALMVAGWIYALYNKNNKQLQAQISKLAVQIDRLDTRLNEVQSSNNDIKLELQRIKAKMWTKQDVKDMIKMQILAYHSQDNKISE